MWGTKEQGGHTYYGSNNYKLRQQSWRRCNFLMPCHGSRLTLRITSKWRTAKEMCLMTSAIIHTTAPSSSPRVFKAKATMRSPSRESRLQKKWYGDCALTSCAVVRRLKEKKVMGSPARHLNGAAALCLYSFLWLWWWKLHPSLLGLWDVR